MKRVKIKALMTISVFTGCLLWSPFSFADSLIIRFTSGKAQLVTLEDSADAVVNIQSQATGTLNDEATQNVRVRDMYIKEGTQKESSTGQGKKATTDKKNAHPLKWGAPKFGE
jgi:hypothetical protein